MPPRKPAKPPDHDPPKKPKKTAQKPAAKKKAAGSRASPPAKKAVRRPGRPTSFTSALAEAICARLAEGESLTRICQSPGMPPKTRVLAWLAEPEREEFRDQYARAREAQADKLAEEILEIADEDCVKVKADPLGVPGDADGWAEVVFDPTAVARNKLRVDARKWLASKMAPKKYGEKITAEHTGADGGAIKVASTVTFVHPPPRPEDDS